MDKPQENRLLVISYLSLRQIIGLLGFGLPVVVGLGAWIIFGTGLQGTLSSYYYTGMRDVFVGTIWAIAFFLLSYKGYDRRDDIIGNLACIFAIGLSIFPTTQDAPPNNLDVIGVIHVICAAAFFSMLIYISFALFTKSRPDEVPSPQKEQRNRIYRICAFIMALCVLGMFLYSVLVSPTAQMAHLRYAPIFWLESIAIMAFGVSWAIKGQILLKDQEEN